MTTPSLTAAPICAALILGSKIQLLQDIALHLRITSQGDSAENGTEPLLAIAVPVGT
jgi:hypothetical protein